MAMMSLSKRDENLIIESGFFDGAWYSNKFPDVSIAGLDPLDHFLRIGSSLGRDPGPMFSGQYYLSQLIRAGISLLPLCPVVDYLQRGWRRRWNPHPLFDVGWYLDRNEDVRVAGIEPLRHFIFNGGIEGRLPHPCFPVWRVLERCPHLRDTLRNPLEFYLSGDWTEDPCPEASAYISLSCAGNAQAISASSLPLLSATQIHTEIPRARIPSAGSVSTDIRAIAIYLPQFHAIPENDAWWGKGFTEWTNVRRATPHYEGHHQPHVPHRDLGQYDLNDPSVMETQAAMARAAGIEGFCFYYYWFNGRRLLNMPTDRLLATGKPDFPFCFCWANENWTRTWDGGDKEILMGQAHCYESDELFILDLIPAFRDPRYIRVDGKPLLVVYRPGLLPDPAATARHWRETCRREGIGEIFLARMQMFDWELEGRDPGYDTVIQFAPVSRGYSPNLKDTVCVHDPAKFTGEVYDYRLSAANYAFETIGPKLWPGVCPSWDNTARRMERGHSWIHSSPENYHWWLSTVVHHARQVLPPQQRFVFINAWNEWAEGCHLEPDEQYGYAWLNATRLALTHVVEQKITCHSQSPRVLVVGHDAARYGAQIVLLAMLREWRAQEQCEFQLVLLGDGVLRKEFEALCPTLVMSDHATEALQKQALQQFCCAVPDVILANTVAAGPLLPALKYLGVPIVAYIHELQKSIERWAPGPIARATMENSNHFIAVSSPVADNLHITHGIPVEKISTLNEYIKTCHSVSLARMETLRAELGIQPEEKLIFGCGTVDWRKGPDLFVQAALEVLKKVPEARFFWIGGESGDEAATRAHALAEDPRIRFLGERENPRDYLALGHVFFLSSREDPFPLVALEAADAGLPVVCFADAGGMPEFVGNTCGRTVPFENIHAAADALGEFLNHETLRQNTGLMAQSAVRGKHDAAKGSRQVFELLEILVRETIFQPARPERTFWLEITAVVPNFNCAPFLLKRLETIARQTLHPTEILILDDASTDSSLEIVSRFAESSPIPCRIVCNEKNSGSPYVQWQRGLLEAKTDLVWIAEADDYSAPSFLEALAPYFNDSSVALAYCQTQPVSESGDPFPGYFGTPLFPDEARAYLPALNATDSIDKNRWSNHYSVDGAQEIAAGLGFQNTIPNGSATLVRRVLALEAISKAQGLKNVGDWAFYLELAKKGKVAYDPAPLNFFRRHRSSLTQSDPISVLRESLCVTLSLIEEDRLPLNGVLDSINRRFLEYDWELRAEAGSPRLYRHPELSEIAERLRLALLRLLPASDAPSILIVLPDAETGGGQTAAVRFANELAKTHRVFLVSARPFLDDDNLSKMLSDRVALLEGRINALAHLRYGAERPGIYETDLSPIRLSALSSLCGWLGIEVVFSHVWWADKLANRLVRATSMRWFIHMHGCYEFLIEADQIDPQFPELARDMFKYVAGVLYLTEKNLAVFDQLQIPKPRLHLSRNGFENPGHSIEHNSAAPFTTAPDEIVFCMCARGIPEKGWEQAIAATHRVNCLPAEQRGHKMARLVTIGTSDYLNDLLQSHARSPEITPLGLQLSPVGIMRHCHIGLLPTYFVSESQPNVIIEYLASGLAVISTKIGAIPGMLVHSEWQAGVALPYADKKVLEESLVVEMASLMRDMRLLDQRRAHAREVFKARFDIQNIAKELSLLFRDKFSDNLSAPESDSDHTNGVKTIAIHLPQFHPFKENNEWWGDGFTEWTNVRKSRPLFAGHDQPRVPADIGYYDLRSAEVRVAQAALARRYGIDGFCYYHYWFHGKRLMTEPLDAIFESGEPDFPFCLCWANETWSRRWLGEEKDVLIEQTYSPEDDVNHSRFLAKVFSDRRYIRINGRPLFIIYRPTQIPVLPHFISSLREFSRLAGAGDPFLLGCSSHAEGTDMRTLGLDGTMDFQPKLGFLTEAFDDKSTPQRLARNRALGVDFPHLRLYDAKDFRKSMEVFRDQLDYPVHPSVFVSWDNTPRRGENGIVLMNNTPEDFGKSLESARRYVNSAKFHGEKVIFINAWNEWAEGNYLEPDIVQGYDYIKKISALRRR
jgi:lipopolysaccharide biosynthesis protein/glycosyltransferase involved in cell wall biosynthesis